jgi:Fe-S cluster assembly ATP-binding protein
VRTQHDHGQRQGYNNQPKNDAKKNHFKASAIILLILKRANIPLYSIKQPVSSMSLNIKNLSISVENKEIIKKVSLEIKPGSVHVIMGPNGSGKTTLANTLMGHPNYKVTAGSIEIDGIDSTSLSPDKRAELGLFLSMQYPPEINGVNLAHFLRLTKQALTKKQIEPLVFHQELLEKMQALHLDPNFLKRSVNTGFSGGEKKKAEILQLLVLDPKYALLDETDSGLDVDALKIVAEGITTFKNKTKGILIITHYHRLLEYLTPDFIHILVHGTIVKTGGKELAQEIDTSGYQNFS